LLSAGPAVRDARVPVTCVTTLVSILFRGLAVTETTAGCD
jgi:hypothetical protein